MTGFATAFFVGLTMCIVVMFDGPLWKDPSTPVTRAFAYIGPTLVFGSSVLFILFGN